MSRGSCHHDFCGMLIMRFNILGRVLFEFDCTPVVATIIYDGVFKRMPLAVMLVDGDKHRNPAKVCVNCSSKYKRVLFVKSIGFKFVQKCEEVRGDRLYPIRIF